MTYIIPADYALKLKKHEKPNIKILIVGSDATTARTILNAAVLSGEKYNKIYIIILLTFGIVLLGVSIFRFKRNLQ